MYLLTTSWKTERDFLDGDLEKLLSFSGRLVPAAYPISDIYLWPRQYAFHLAVNLESVYRPIIVVSIAHVDELSTPGIGAEIRMNIYLCQLRPWDQGGHIQSKLIGSELHHIRSVLSSSLWRRWLMIGWMGHGWLWISETSFSALYGTGLQMQWAVEWTEQ